MDYPAHYARLIERARLRAEPNCYVERHHVIPRCLGGTDAPENIVILTGPEHYVAHLLLVCMNPKHEGLIWSAINMSSGSSSNRIGRSGNKLYGWLRQAYADAKRGKKRTYVCSDGTRAKMSLARRGKKLKPWSAEMRARASAERTGKKRGPQRPEQVEARAALIRGTKRSPEARARMSAARKGRKFGPHSAERRAKIGNSQRGKIISLESRMRMSDAARRRHAVAVNNTEDHQ